MCSSDLSCRAIVLKAATLSVGFIPLVDAAPLIVAHEMGFAAEEGIGLDLRRAPSWSALRDLLSFGHIEAAHMLSPVPVAAALGLGGGLSAPCFISILSMNGDVICPSRAPGEKLRISVHHFGLDHARAQS